MTASTLVDDFRRYALRKLDSGWCVFRSRWPAGDWQLVHASDDVDALAGRSCYGILHEATAGVSAWMMVFPPVADGEPFKLLPRLFVPTDRVEGLGRCYSVDLRGFVQMGLAIETDAGLVDCWRIRLQILEDAARFDIRSIAFDSWDGTGSPAWLERAGLPMVRAVFSDDEVKSESHGRCLDLVSNGRFRRCGQDSPVL
ncbi:hypothetical protein [Laribacter hongkongensis]|uniref:hypothetical protein n=1 Tax=Laribacter hongkongensis TaxID=168471 RepID=UPI001EFD6F0A|nr:hypothetical protein [Laribacter hongkongensis]MCG9094443.1 hypothetical protein [Laribacter hongkongensis]